MTQFDIIYKDLVNKIINEGHLSSGNVRTKYLDGTPAHYKSYIGYQFRLDNSTDEALVITSRKAPWKSAIRELEWIWVRQSNDVNELEQMGCKFWSEFGIKETENREITSVSPRKIEINLRQIEPFVKIQELLLDRADDTLYSSNNYGDFYLLTKEGKYRTVQFKDTGFITTVTQSTFSERSIRDPYRRTIHNIGYYGDYKNSEILEYFGEYHNKWVTNWENMIRRCSQDYDSWKKWYEGCVLHESFECCEYFLRWIMKNNRYDKKALKTLQIDKDYYGSNGYGPDTCTLLTPKENTCLTLDEWYKYDNLYFFSKIDLAKYLFKQRQYEKLFKKSGECRYPILNKVISSLREAKELEVFNPKNEINGKLIRFKLEPKNTILHAYGRALRTKTYGFESQVHYILNEIKNNPNSRRIITEIWLPEQLDNMSLNPCVHLTQWTVIDNKLYLEVRQRSCDVALGLTANVWQYSILHKLIAHECGLEPAELIWTIHNAHIYDRHIEKIQKQIQNITDVKPKVTIEYPNDFFEFKSDMIKLENYNITNDIKYDLAV